MKKAYKIVVTGMVQGIGFRPYVAELAEEYCLAGQVKNLGGIVEILVAGEEQAVEQFVHRLYVLPGCRIDSLEQSEYLEAIADKFFIADSAKANEMQRFLPEDLPTCARCVAEMKDPKKRRYRYPFISCTACGPRYSIQRSVPYDRDSITMEVFEMCDACKKEYTQKGNIRRHAQTISCKDCGPRLAFIEKRNTEKEITDSKTHTWERVLELTIDALKNGRVGAVKDIGGFHLVCSPFLEEPVARLRNFKNREKKPFAVMFPSLDSIREYCFVTEKEQELLESDARPIVLLQKKKDFVKGVCGDSLRIGAMLPCNPLQILLTEALGPLVMTSGNKGGEPIAIADTKMEPYVETSEIDFMLTHNREILTPLDDSIYQVVLLTDADGVKREHVQVIRRARGLVPKPIQLPARLPEETYAAGGDLKAVFALGKNQYAYLSQYFGDLEDMRCAESREKAKERMERLFCITPLRTVGDMHPAYVSAKDTQRKIQHHHAHAASVIAEHGLDGRVLAVVCDGTGYGTDKTIWGSEVLLCHKSEMTRVASFESVKLLGGDAAAKDADLTLRCCLWQSGLVETTLQRQAWQQNINTAYASSMGRLFDAVSALLDICHYNSYEGECAIALEQAAYDGYRTLSVDKTVEAVWKSSPFSFGFVEKAGILCAESVKLIQELVKQKQNYSKEELAYYFHHEVAQAIIFMVEKLCEKSEMQEVEQVVLSGGTFVNRILLKEVYEGLIQKGKKVYINEKVPCGDGGIALGQLYLTSFDN